MLNAEEATGGFWSNAMSRNKSKTYSKKRIVILPNGKNMAKKTSIE
jgi:hypothetical protein